MARTSFETESRTIILQGNVEHPTAEDRERVGKIQDELASRHEGGKIVHQSSKGSKYKQLKISWVSKPRLERER